MIENDEQYMKAMCEITKLMDIDPEPHTPEGHRLDELARQTEEYEKKQGWCPSS